MGVKLVAVHKDSQGNIDLFQTDDGQVISFSEAKELAVAGRLDSLTDIFQDGSWRIETADQYMEGSNLADLPEF